MPFPFTYPLYSHHPSRSALVTICLWNFSQFLSPSIGSFWYHNALDHLVLYVIALSFYNNFFTRLSSSEVRIFILHLFIQGLSQNLALSKSSLNEWKEYVINTQEKCGEQMPRHSIGWRLTGSHWEMSEGIRREASREPGVRALKKFDGVIVIGDSAWAVRAQRTF